MVKRMDLSHAPCPVARALDVIGDWWSLMIIRDAFDGLRRFGALQASLGIAKGMLSARLRDLVERGILETQPASDGSAYLEYVLTAKGKGLFVVVAALRQWGEAELFAASEAHSVLVDVRHTEPVAPLVLKAKDGRTLAWTETLVIRADESARTSKSAQ
jgi:DNA-binding HxlR family transcriptional regulator